MTEEQLHVMANCVGPITVEQFRPGETRKDLETCLATLLVATASAILETFDRDQIVRFANELHLQLDPQLGLESQLQSHRKATILRQVGDAYDRILET